MIEGFNLIDTHHFVASSSKMACTTYRFKHNVTGGVFTYTLHDWKLAVKPLEEWLQEPESQAIIAECASLKYAAHA